MSRFYEENELHRIQQIELHIFDDFAEICEKYQLQYFAIAGTGLGAIRHKGYIPWDDDMDIAMPRKDYEKLILIIEKNFSDKYYILNAEHYENFPLMTTRICLKGTKFVEEAFMNIDCPFGIFLDLYAYDNLADGKFAYNLQIWTAWFWSKILILRSIKTPFLFQQGIKAKIIKFICTITYHILNFFHISKKSIYKKCKKACTRYNNIETKRIGFPCDTNPNWNVLEKNKIFPVSYWKFEEREIRFPKDMNSMLEKFYGDTYMQLPPVEKRKTHFPYILDFGDGQRVVDYK